MPIIECTNTSCKTKMQVGDDAGGKQFRCPACKTIFTVPSAPTRREPAAVGAAASSKPAAPPMPPPPRREAKGGVAPAAKPPPVPAPAPKQTFCPACGEELLPGAVACQDCGYLIQGAASAAEADSGAVSLCPNPACGVANPPGERNCQRCSTPLPYPRGT